MCKFYYTLVREVPEKLATSSIEKLLSLYPSQALADGHGSRTQSSELLLSRLCVLESPLPEQITKQNKIILWCSEWAGSPVPLCVMVLLSPSLHVGLVVPSLALCCSQTPGKQGRGNRWPSQGLICTVAIEATKAVPEEDGIGSHGRFVQLGQSKTQCRALFLFPFQKPVRIAPSTDRGHSVSLLSTAGRPKGCEKEDVFERGRSLLASW